MPDLTDKPCLVCGGTAYDWGTAAAQYNLKFQSSDGGIWKALAGPILTGEPIIARKCNSCGNVQLFVPSEG